MLRIEQEGLVEDLGLASPLLIESVELLPYLEVKEDGGVRETEETNGAGPSTKAVLNPDKRIGLLLHPINYHDRSWTRYEAVWNREAIVAGRSTYFPRSPDKRWTSVTEAQAFDIFQDLAGPWLMLGNFQMRDDTAKLVQACQGLTEAACSGMARGAEHREDIGRD
ncbi:hypothetical protein SISNIDRAFT_463171 [Sistotremastrum niveocremeum HHB9708]|uniref:Uncharacterized protein n=1 Tax=Sistotremastrum niveocremeum HHB9708 TaxID=1314777 RepID=A0A164YU86_9AGAM|nr:hypothetical protein SISNIDRAFT_463171 [Sistotremastrum niveocremeum HHB9708]